MPHDIFISYSRRDLSAVQPIKEELEAQGFSCWMDLESVESGHESFPSVIAPALEQFGKSGPFCGQKLFSPLSTQLKNRFSLLP